MSTPIATYSFLPWLRQGIANQITTADLDHSVKFRATINIQVKVTGEKVDGGTLTKSVSKAVQLYGPGDIVGIDSRAIVKAEPRNWVTNFEPNYCPFVDFYDEDFPWRYTPAAPDKTLSRLRPWIALIVLKESEFTEGTNILNKPLSYIRVTNSAVFPPAKQLWAWAHVHVNRDLGASASEIVSGDMSAVLPRFQAVLKENPDLAYSRILSPRKLEANAPYHAFLVPVFESGRLAGLGLDPAKAPDATHSAWASYQGRAEPNHYPFYYRWFFRTGTLGDFEYLVRLLQPKPVDARVGRRDMDVQEPGANLSGITDSALGGVLKLGGALQIPFDTLKPADQAEVSKYENWDQPYPHDFQQDLASFINLADDYSAKPATQANSDTSLDPAIQNDPDPLITPPLYGRWHALVQRMLTDRSGSTLPTHDNWVHELNLDPRFRAAAGFGTQVVQTNQEAYMDAAWEQVGRILEANRRIRLAQLAAAVSNSWYTNHLLPLEAVNIEKALVLTAPVHKRVVAKGFTVHHQVKASLVPVTTMTTTARQALRPGGRLVKRTAFTDRARPDNLLTRLNAGRVTAARPKGYPAGAATLRDAAESLMPTNAPRPLLDWLRRYNWLKYLPVVLALLVALLLVILRPTGFWLALGLVAVAALGIVARLLFSLASQVAKADSVLEQNQTPAAVDGLPKSPDFVVTRPGDGVRPSRGATDSPQATRFKQALKNVYTLIGASKTAAAEPPKVALDLPFVSGAVVQAIDPTVTVPQRTMSGISLPKHLLELIGEQFKEAMAYPEFDAPMYKPLVDTSTDLFLHNINYVEQNSISLLETNQRFIEAYMVGLNHEFARELLWREYPTDQRGSTFRQFWDVSGFLDPKNLDSKALREKLKDIPPLHLWSRSSKLGDHDHREASGDKEEEVVLVIRGELLKKYPTAVIYAHRAQWQKTDGAIDNTKERRLVQLTASEDDQPPKTKVKTPLYQAKVDPDIYFFGFDLTAEVARGGTGEDPNDDPGWFFVIKERPGEPRFGLDIDKQPQLNTWSDLSWDDVLPGGTAGSYIQITSATPQLSLVEPTGADSEKHPQWKDDKAVPWNKNTNAAQLAYILYQTPVLVAVHASEMLPAGQ